jgi:hypothetical protein
MATSKCPKCDNKSFELKSAKIKDCRPDLNFIQCASCGAVIGVLDPYRASILVRQLAKKLGFNLPVA